MKSKRKPFLGPSPKNIWRDVRLSLKVLKRCNKPDPWIHYIKNDYTSCGKGDTYRLFCGPRMVTRLNDVTCPRCIEALKKSHWYCPTHGFIDDTNVTNDEKCETCGQNV